MAYDVEVCRKCDGFSHITNSRPSDEGRIRRRECAKCGHRWSTIEIRVLDYQKMGSSKWGHGMEQKLQDLLHEVRTRFLP